MHAFFLVTGMACTQTCLEPMIVLPQPPKSAMIKDIFHTIMADLRIALTDSLLHSANMKCLLFAGYCIEY